MCRPALLLVVASVIICFPEASSARLLIGAKAPPLVLRQVGMARPYSLYDYAGKQARTPKKAVVISFFATWCAPCKKELPILKRLMERLACKQLDAVLVGMGESERTLLKVARRNKVRLSVLTDLRRVASRQWKATSLSATFVVDGRGRIGAAFYRARRGFGRNLEQAIRRLVRPRAIVGT